MSDGKEAKTLVIDEIHTNQGGFYKLPNGLYAHYSCGNPEKERELGNKIGKAKFIFLDDLSQPKSENNAVVNLEKLKEWYEHCVGKSNLTVLGGTVMRKGDLDKFTKKEQDNEQTASED